MSLFSNTGQCSAKAMAQFKCNWEGGTKEMQNYLKLHNIYAENYCLLIKDSA